MRIQIGWYWIGELTGNQIHDIRFVQRDCAFGVHADAFVRKAATNQEKMYVAPPLLWLRIS